ncbi:unnamed protein product [Dovyalis caffra]|uniref:Ribosomal protein L2 n=1 Tax=Dovyalis caffra TaxID=77055 RepID=A0AAV1SQC3_9ROSI|nr:unnamed protein product [Dovyalis caffra]
MKPASVQQAKQPCANIGRKKIRGGDGGGRGCFEHKPLMANGVGGGRRKSERSAYSILNYRPRAAWSI